MTSHRSRQDADHPITPPPNLIREWSDTAPWDNSADTWIANKAARWGADQELEACCEWIVNCKESFDELDLHNARRPKPPSLKEQALEVVTGLEKRWDLQCDLTLLRRALEALPE